MDKPEPPILESIGHRFYAKSSVRELVSGSGEPILAELLEHTTFDVTLTQRDAWCEQIEILRQALDGLDVTGQVYFEFSVPRVGKRIDTLLVLSNCILVIEFKTQSTNFPAYAVEQVWDYGLDLKNFHSESHDKVIVPILVATAAPDNLARVEFFEGRQSVFQPIKCTTRLLSDVIRHAVSLTGGPVISSRVWETGYYKPTPTIIDAAVALYGGHSVAEITRSDASAQNLTDTSWAVSQIIEQSRAHGQKSICFVTGVPGAGKTLVGLDAATRHISKDDELYSVFLSGNGPLVRILQEALARDKVAQKKEAGERFTLSAARSEVKAFIQNVHHFRDAGLIDPDKPPIEHVALFDEAQRAWNLRQTASFMQRKKGRVGFPYSEPEFLISCIDRHQDWAVIVCLVGGGQEINTGEAGIGEWIEAVLRSYRDWHVYVSPNLHDSEFGAGKALQLLAVHPNKHFDQNLHLSVSMRSFRAEHVSGLVKALLDLEADQAGQFYAKVCEHYPIVITRSLQAAKDWVRQQAGGSQRFGMMVSSQAERLRPLAIDVRVNVDPVHWFLDPREDVRSSWFLEDAASEFDVQGLELDWTIVVWDADFRHTGQGWQNWGFKGSHWQRIKAEERKLYQKNAYRVLLTRARQGMVIVVPEGDEADHTRLPEFYNGTWKYLRSVGFAAL